MIIPAKKKITYTPDGKGRYKYRNVGYPILMICYENGILRNKYIDHNEIFEGTDACKKYGSLNIILGNNEFKVN